MFRSPRISVLLIGAFLAAAVTTTSTAQTPRWKIDSGPVSLDGPIGRDGVFPGPAPAPPPITTLAEYKFNLPSPDETNCLTEDWTTHDLNNAGGQYFHVDTYGAIDGTQSLWCGADVSSTEPLCTYGFLPGYGNNWDQAWCTKSCLAVVGNVEVWFKAAWDTEAGKDETVIEFDECDDNWQPIGDGGPFSGTGFAAGASTIFAAQHNGNVRIRFRFRSDNEGSDEDYLDTNGAFFLDSLAVGDDNGEKLPVEFFQDESVGDVASNDWEACPVPPQGDFACLFPGGDAVQQVAATDKDLSCIWGFFCNSPDYYTCGFPAQLAVPHENADGQFVRNEIWSPWIPYTMISGATAQLDFDVYRDLTIDNLVFYTWRVRSVENVGDCPDEWRQSNFVYYGGPDWHTHHVYLDPYLPFGNATAQLQVALGVIDLCDVWGGIFGSCACHTNSPMFDNVHVYLDNTHTWAVDDVDLFQDSFPGDGTTTGTVRLDTPAGDSVSVLVTEPSVGIDDLVTGNPASGPAVFCHVRNLPGKSGGAVSGGSSWPDVPAMSTSQWTVLQMAPGPVLNSYDFDLNDNLYTPGDTVSFYFSARDKGGNTSYFSHLIGRTVTEGDVQAYPMEMTCLPAGAAQGSKILYVDAYDGMGAEPYFQQALELMGIEVDRFDRRSPSSRMDNSLGDEVAALAQIQDYDAILFNSGSLPVGGAFNDSDYRLLFDYLNLTPGVHGVYFSGDNLASELASSTDPNAALLRTTFIDYTVVSDDHKSLGEDVSPLVIGEPGSAFDGAPGPDTLVAYGGIPAVNRFDVVTPAGGSVLEMSYAGNAAHGAVVSHQVSGGGGYQATVLLSGFSFHHVRDERPRGTEWDRPEHLMKILQVLGMVPPYPVDARTQPSDRLAQNYPNPFNPSTVIEYSIKEPSHVRLAVYDVSGRLVRVLVDGDQRAAGSGYRAVWDGTGAHGEPVASGVYFYRLTTERFTRTRKMVLLK